MLSSTYKRILLKLSGESLMGDQPFGISHIACQEIAKAIQTLRQEQFEVAVVIGGGNIFRGIKLKDGGMPQTPADQMGMLGTLINGIALQQALESIQCPALVMSALDCPKVAPSYNWPQATQALNEGRVVLFVGGTGNPYFTTDTAAALRASEIQADLILKATKVDGIYDCDPVKHPHAKKYNVLSYTQVLTEKLEVMDATAIAFCRSYQIPIYVFNMNRLGQEPLRELLNQDPNQKNFHGTFVLAGEAENE